MKSTKILAVLAGTALLTACSQEELFEANNTPQQMEEVVGAKLAGTDISMNVSMTGSSAQSRYAGGESGWGNSDVVGLGWILNGNISDVQSENKIPDASGLYANHMFGTENKGDTWSTKGNLYEGWYFAYYPWSYEAKAGKIKKYEMNPKMLDRGAAYHQSQSLYLSNNQFISESDIDKNTNSLTDDIKLYQAVKFIQITAKAQEESTFAKGGDLSGLQIDKVTISAGEKNIFADKVNIYAKNLPNKFEYSEEETKAETDKRNLAAFRGAYSNVVTATKISTISRDVTEADLLVSTNPTAEGKNVNVYLNVLPATDDDLTLEDITVTFHSGAASFVIAYDENISDTNKAAFEALVAAYHKDGVLSTIDEVDENGNPKEGLTPLRLTLELCAEDFVTDFSSITTVDEWNEAVTLVQRLKRSEAEFCIDGNIEFDGKIKMPEGCALTVTAVTDENADETKTLADNVITLKGTHDGIPAELNIEGINVVVEGTVNEAQTIVANTITNNGTLKLGQGTSVDVQKVLDAEVINNNVIEMAEYSMITKVNNKGRIIIVYKSAIELAEGGENGEIVYEVTKLDTPTRIQNVLRTTGNNQYRHAQVNVLVFDSENKISEFDLTYNTNDEGEDDYYNSTLNPGQSGITYEGLDKVSLEINGVNVSSTKDVTVKNVEITDANLGAGITVGGDLTVKGGNVLANVAKIEGALTIEAGQGEINAATIGSVDIASGNFTINAETINQNVVAVGENYFNVENFNGTVTLENTTPNASVNIDGATFKGNVTLSGNFGLVNIALPKDLTVVGGSVKMDNVNIGGTLTNDGTVTISGDDNIVIKKIVNNKELAASTTIYVEQIILKNEVSKTNVQENPEKIIYYSEYYGQGGNTTGKILPSTITIVDNEWQIHNAEGLKAFAALVNAGTSFVGKTIKLVDNIDLKNAPWSGIGTVEAPFDGCFDGNEKTISNLFMENTERSGNGLFSRAEGTKNSAVILKNLTLKNVTLKGGNDVGALLGSTGRYVSISNITLTGDVKIEGKMNVGGLVGETCKTISNVKVDVDEGSFVQSSYGPVGGVVGLLVENYHAESIESNIDVFAKFVSEQYSNNNGAGGIFGFTNGYGSTVKNCKSTGDVTVENTNVETLKMRIGGISGGVHGGGIKFISCEFAGSLKNTFNGNEITDFPNNSFVGETNAKVSFE